MRKVSIFYLLAALLLVKGAVYAKELVVIAGSEPVENCPVVISLSPDEFWVPLGQDEWKAVNGDEVIPVQVIRRNMPEYAFQANPSGPQVKSIAQYVWEIHFLVDGLEPYEKRVYQLEKGSAKTGNTVSLTHGEGKIDVKIGSNPFTTYDYSVDEKQPRPIMYPLYGPGGAGMTRGYPMDYHEGEAKDHPHHTSVWVSHGDVNGVDFWLIGERAGYQRNVEFSTVESGPVFGRIESVNSWQDKDGSHILSDRRTITMWGTDDEARFVDIDITFIADAGDVKFGDTKEGGLLSLRVAATMKEKQEEKEKEGGLIVNSNGEKTMREAWGKAAPWCDYSGPVGDITAGLTIMDHPENAFYPTRYHVRDYGLFTANPFGLSYFLNDKSQDGSQVLKNGQTWRQRYRLYIHKGDLESGNVVEQYSNYADAPKAYIQ